MAKIINIDAELKSLDTIEVSVYKQYTTLEIKAFNFYDNGKFVKTLKWISKSESKSSFIYILNINYEFIPGHLYELCDDRNEFFPLDISIIALSSEFEKKYRFDGEMGAIYSKESTTFRVFSPLASEAFVKLIDKNEVSTLHPMARLENSGVYEAIVKGNCEEFKYHFVVNLNGQLVEATDPYAFALTSNSRYGYVVNPEKLQQIDLHKESLPPFNKLTDAIIYEIDVRDATSLTGFENKGTFKALSQEGLKDSNGNPVGLDYIKSLEVTHVQLLPVYDFQTIDEDHPAKQYNWGYDPKFYFAPEGSYSTNPDDCYTRLFELRELVGSFHKNGLRAVMDVVFNHTFNRISNSLEQLCPGYYFRKNNDGTYSNGSGCGNDIESCHYMARKLIIDALVHFVKWYGFDGYRFDLMGILDKETINKAYYTLKNINKDIIMYGEGWNMATNLPSSLKANSNNAKEMPTIGFFNDRFREVVKGASSDNNLASKGYLSGDTNYIDGFKHCILGSCVALAFPPMFDEPTQSINYVECHDNATIFDKLLLSNADESVENRLKRIKMMNVVSILSYGIPFIHAGQEFGATKKSHYNSYNLIDEINGLDYNLRTARKDMVKYLADAIKLRKNMDIFRLDKKEDIVNAVTFENLSHGALLIKYDDKANSRIVYFFINPTTETVSYKFDNYAKIIFNEAGLINTDFFSQLMIINGLSLIVALSNY